MSADPDHVTAVPLAQLGKHAVIASTALVDAANFKKWRRRD